MGIVWPDNSTELAAMVERTPALNASLKPAYHVTAPEGCM